MATAPNLENQNTECTWSSPPRTRGNGPLSLVPLSVSSLTRVVPRDISDTHVLAAWNKVGLVRPSPAFQSDVNIHRRVVFQD